MNRFVKSAIGLGLASALALTAATPSLARSRHWGPAVGAGIVAGAIIGSAVANAQYYNGVPYAYSDDYAYAPGYDAYAYEPGYTRSYAPRSYREFGYAPGDAPSYDRERQLRGTDY